jgi:hypothetical protein
VGGADSSGYANAARALLERRLVQPVDALTRLRLPASDADAFIPLGYVRGPRAGTMSPLYPAGFPLHLAAAAAAGGWSLFPFLVSPLAALLALAAMYLVGRELGLSPWPAAAGSAILAACPVFVFQAIQPMSDVVATFWCLAAVLCALRSAADWRWSLAAGFSFGMAVLVRPIDVLLFVPLAFAMPWDRRRAAAFAAGGLPLAAVLAAYDAACYGSPLATGYGLTRHWDALAWSNFPSRFVDYARWTALVLTPLVAVGWLAALADRSLSVRIRACLFTWFATLFTFHCFYAPADAWWYTRFLLPGLPPLILGFLLALRSADATISSRWPRSRVALLAAEVLLLGLVVRTGFRNTRRLGVFDLPRQQAAYPEGCRLAERTVPPGSLVLSSHMSGALRFYTGLTPVRWDALDAARFASLRAAGEKTGARWYALLMPDETSEAWPRLPGTWSPAGEAGEVRLWRLERADALPAPGP